MTFKAPLTQEKDMKEILTLITLIILIFLFADGETGIDNWDKFNSIIDAEYIETEHGLTPVDFDARLHKAIFKRDE